jgi:iron complex outermembrane recepter protein
MNRRLAILFFSLFLSVSLSADPLRGVVTDAAGRPLTGATVSIPGGRTSVTDAEGGFAFDLPSGTYPIRVSRTGYEAQTRRVSTGEPVVIALAAAYAETITVSAIRAEDELPVTKSEIVREEIEERYHGQDIPLLLRDTPSIHAYTESGVGGSGYSYISLRGIGLSRINFTLDGVPLADSEDMGTYFADFPDLARSLESVQIQRGVGISTFGSASFGGSVNLESIQLSRDERIDATLGAGSYGNTQATVGYQSGALSNGFSLYTRLSWLENDGFRDNSGVEQRNIFVSAAKEVGVGLLKLTGFSGVEQQQLSFYATDAETLATNLRENPMSPEETDRFNYDLAQLQYIRPISDAANMTASVYYQRGYGWYRLFDWGTDVLRQYGLDGALVGSILTYSRSAGALQTNYGVHVNRFKRDHTSDEISTGSRDYANYGVKGEANAFAKAGYTLGRWLLFGDAQVRYADFEYHGDLDIRPISWTFFNPKIGARFHVSPATSLYGSAGITRREPGRLDMFQGEDNPSIAYDLRAVRPERVLNYEAGWNYRRPHIDLAANVYAMEFRNEIAATGELTDMGLPLRRNVDQSYRRGIELDAAWQVIPAVRLRTNANVSRNRIREWTQFYDVYDEEWNWTDVRALTFRNVAPLLSPEILVNQAVAYTPNARFSAGLVGRHAAKSYLDNTNDETLTTPSFTTVDANVSYAVTPWARLALQVNNLFDNDRVYASGYSYLYYLGEQRTGTAYYYPQATRNAVVLLHLGF